MLISLSKQKVNTVFINLISGHIKKMIGLIVLFVFGWLCTPLLANAQYSIGVIKMNNLFFGGMVAGDSKTILPSDPSAAMFQISAINDFKNSGDNDHDSDDGTDDISNGNHYGWQDITIKFDLPGQLLNYAHSLPITFGSNSAMWSNSSNINGAKTFDPNQQQQLKLHKNKSIYIWLGGTVSSSLSQWSGWYSSIITISINSIDN